MKNATLGYTPKLGDGIWTLPFVAQAQGTRMVDTLQEVLRGARKRKLPHAIQAIHFAVIAPPNMVMHLAPRLAYGGQRDVLLSLVGMPMRELAGLPDFRTNSPARNVSTGDVRPRDTSGLACHVLVLVREVMEPNLQSLLWAGSQSEKISDLTSETGSGRWQAGPRKAPSSDALSEIASEVGEGAGGRSETGEGTGGRGGGGSDGNGTVESSGRVRELVERALIEWAADTDGSCATSVSNSMSSVSAPSASGVTMSTFGGGGGGDSGGSGVGSGSGGGGGGGGGSGGSGSGGVGSSGDGGSSGVGGGGGWFGVGSGGGGSGDVGDSVGVGSGDGDGGGGVGGGSFASSGGGQSFEFKPVDYRQPQPNQDYTPAASSVRSSGTGGSSLTSGAAEVVGT